MTLKTLTAALLLAAVAPLAAAAAGDGEALARDNCASCHALARPDYQALGHGERATRQAPPPYYAGNKFRAEWLEAWLQKLERLSPARVLPPATVTSGPDADVIDAAALVEHPALDAAEARLVSEYLMSLRPHDE